MAAKANNKFLPVRFRCRSLNSEPGHLDPYACDIFVPRPAKLHTLHIRREITSTVVPRTRNRFWKVNELCAIHCRQIVILTSCKCLIYIIRRGSMILGALVRMCHSMSPSSEICSQRLWILKEFCSICKKRIKVSYACNCSHVDTYFLPRTICKKWSDTNRN